MVKNLPANAGDARDESSIPGREESGVGNGNLLQYFCLENPLDRRARQFHRVAKSQTLLSTPPPTHTELYYDLLSLKN